MKNKILWIISIGGLGLLVIAVIALFSSKKTYFNPMLGSRAARSLEKYDFEKKMVTVTFKNGKVISGVFTQDFYYGNDVLKSLGMAVGFLPGGFRLYQGDYPLGTKLVIGERIGTYNTSEVLTIKKMPQKMGE